jgi:aminopeptidase N
MHRAIRTTGVTLALALLVGSASSAPGSRALTLPRYSGALSHPREDPYYPTKGDPRVDALHYRLDLRWAPKSRVLTGTATIRLRVTRDVKRLRLDLGDPLAVGVVRLDGESVPARHPGKNLVIYTGPLAKDSRHTVRVAYSGHPEPVKAPVSRGDFSTVGWTTTTTGDAWTMQEPFGAFTWYPVNDHPSDKAYYDVRIQTPQRDVGIFNGHLTSRRTLHGRTVTRWHLGSPAASYLTTIAIGDYRRYRDTGPHGLPITYWVERHDRDLLPWLRRTPSMIRWLEGRLGPYPFAQIGTVVVPSESAMETQTLVTMGQGLGASRELFVTDLLHEYSHQWYGDSVTPNNWKDLWLNEGFAMYLQIRYEVDKGYTTMQSWRRTLRATDQSLRNEYGPPGEYFRHDFASTNVYYCVAYMLDRLHSKLGNRMFDRVLRQWPQRHHDTNADRGEWIAWLNRVTGRHLRSFVVAWLTSKHTPTR